MTAYIISIGEGKAKEATRDIYKRDVNGVCRELASLAETFGKGVFKTPTKVSAKRTFYKECEVSAKFIKDRLKEDTLHLVYAMKGNAPFWVNINTVEIS